jgi:hypothetical protein
MNDHGKSDGRVVPAKLPNNAGVPVAEVVEERRPAEGNAASKTRPGRRAGSFRWGCQLSEDRLAGAAIRSWREAWARSWRPGAKTGPMCARAIELAQRAQRPGSRPPGRQGRRPGGLLPGVIGGSGTRRYRPTRVPDREDRETAPGNGQGTTSHKHGPELARVDPPSGARTAAPDQTILLLIGQK